MLFETFNGIQDGIGKDYFKKKVPEYIANNLNSTFELREYQKESIGRMVHYFTDYPNRILPTQLLYHMATGSGSE